MTKTQRKYKRLLKEAKRMRSDLLNNPRLKEYMLWVGLSEDKQKLKIGEWQRYYRGVREGKMGMLFMQLRDQFRKDGTHNKDIHDQLKYAGMESKRVEPNYRDPHEYTHNPEFQRLHLRLLSIDKDIEKYEEELEDSGISDTFNPFA